MPRLVYTRRAIADIQRCRRFLAAKSPAAALRAAKVLDLSINALTVTPHIGRPLPDNDEIRELVVPFGDAGYVVLYRHLPMQDAVFIVSIRHQKEADYQA